MSPDPDDCGHERTPPNDDGDLQCARCGHVFARPTELRPPKRVPPAPEMLKRVRQLRADIRKGDER